MALLSSLLEILNSTPAGALITSVVVTDSGYSNLDDTAIATSNSFIKIIGSGFTANSNVFIGNIQVPAANVTFTGTTELRVALPNITLGTDSTVSVFNSTGSGGIYASRVLSSGFPTITTSAYTSATLTLSAQLLATGDGSLTYSLKSGSSLPTGLTLNANGLISGTATADQTASFTVLVNDSQNQTTQQDITLLISTTDTLFNYTTLLVQADNVANNSTNGSAVDSANSYNLVVSGGTPIQGSINPFGVGNWSNSFNGTNQYISASANTAFAFGTGDFTVEGWIFTTARIGLGNYGSQIAGCQVYGTSADWLFNISPTGNLFFQIGASAVGAILTTSTVPLNLWTHVALVRQSGTVTIYINGVNAGGSASYATSITNASTPFSIGGASNGTAASLLQGYISNLRIVKGTALYTSAFTPSTSPLTAVANTVLLTCQSNRFVDNSTNAFTLTPTNSPTVERFNAFDVNANSYTTQANTMISGSTYVGSGYHYFGHSGFGSGDFSVEFWTYVTASGGSLFNNYVQYSPGDNGMYILYDGAGSRFNAYVKRDNGYDSGNLYAGTSLSLNTWYHVVLCRTSGTLSLFVNGTRGSTVSNYVQTFTQTQSGIGNNGSGTSYQGNSQCAGAYLSNFRIMAGTSAYNAANSSFTVPTTPLTAVANTLFLAYQTSQGESSRTVTTSGTVTASKLAPPTLYSAVTDTSTANTVYNGSYQFNGSSDYLYAPNSVFNIGSSTDFTIEMWIYPRAGSAEVIGSYSGGTSTNWLFRLGADLTPDLYQYPILDGANSGAGFNTALKVNAWSHLVLSRTGTTTYGFVNGVLAMTKTGTAYALSSVGNPIYIGAGYSNRGFFNGYISNLRLIKGSNLYTSSFTPPTAPLTPVANTSLLLTGTNAGIYDQTLQNNIRTIGTTVNNNVYKYGTGSMFFNGSTSYLLINNSLSVLTPLTVSGSTMTMEAWVYPTALRAGSQSYTFPCILGMGGTYMNFGVNNGTPTFYWYTGSQNSLASSITIAANTWSHIAVVINGSGSNNLKIYVNGVLGATGTFTNISWSSASGGNNIYVGTEESNIATSGWPGYIDELRITRSARYTANFTPSTVAFNSKSRSN
jgi:hypothetical protein